MARGRKPKFTRDEIEHMREMYRRPGVSMTMIAKLYRCSLSTVTSAVEGKLKAKDEEITDGTRNV